MACKKSELIQAVQTFGNARASNDPNLVQFAANLLTQFIDSLEFAEEDVPEEVTPTEVVED
jgi:predicted membrane GTPase involved in stress response